MRIERRILLVPLLALLALSGCVMPINDLAVPIDRDPMAVPGQAPLVDSALGPVNVHAVGPIFSDMTPVSPEIIRRAVEDALRGANLFGADQTQPVTIDARVVGASIPSMDFGPFASTLSIDYKAVLPDGRVLFDETVTAQGRDDTGAFLGEIRYKRSIASVIGNNAKALRERMRLALNAGGTMLAAPAPPPRPAATPQRPAPVLASPVLPPRFPSKPVNVQFRRGSERPDDVAVVIGNADYAKQGRDIPDVKPAYADAEGAKRYATQALGIKEGNVIFLKDATGAQMTRVFGSDKDHRGQLHDWVKPGKSRVFVYYSGHGAPGTQGGSPYLVPADADAARIELNGYPLSQLYANLSRLPAEGVTVVLEACFSGLSSAGSVLGKASPVYIEVKAPPVPARLTVIAAGAANQIASWEPDESHGLFTRNFLEGMAGKADVNKDGTVGLDELDRHLKDTLTYLARRHYGRDQQAQIVRGPDR